MNPKYRTMSMIARGALLTCACAAGAALAVNAAAAAPTAATPAAATAAPATAAATAPAPPATAAATAQAPPAAAADPPAAAAPPDPASGATPAPDAAAGAAAPDAPSSDFKTLDQEVQGLKKDVIDLNKDLFVLEEELLFPANTQVALYVSMDVGTFFALDSVTVKIDNKEVKNYLYTAREADALLKGGVQQIYLGNLKVGKHELVAFFTGKGPAERDYKRGATLNFDKGVGAKYLELKITDRVAKHQPEFTIKDWE
jgi:glucose/arabinose dehydrogenase